MVKPKVSSDVQIAAFIKHKNELFVEKKVKPCTDKVFKILSKQLGMTPEAIRCSVVRKTNIILGADEQKKNEETPNENWNQVSITESNFSSENQSIENDVVDSFQSDDPLIQCVSTDKNTKLDESNEILSDATRSSSLNGSENGDIVPSDTKVKVSGKMVSFAVDVKVEDIFGISYKKQGKKIA